MNHKKHYKKENKKGPDIFSIINEAEQVVLGKIIWNPNLISQLVDSLKPKDFRYERHKLIFNAMLILNSQGIPIDEMTIWSFLNEKGELDKVGGSSYITYLPLVALNVS